MRKVLVGLLSSVVALSSFVVTAETTIAPVKNLDELLQNVKEGKNKESITNNKRIAEFKAALNRQDQLLREAKAELARQQARSEELKAAFLQNEEDLANLEKEKTLKVGNMGEMVGVVRQVAADTAARVDNSVISAQLPNRGAYLERLAQSKELPRIVDLRKMWAAMLEEMTQSGKIVKFNADVTTREGSSENREITRIGSFNLLSNGEYLFFDLESDTIKELLRQPDADVLAMVSAYENGSGAMPLALDPSRGNLLSLIVQKPTFEEYFEQGGPIGKIIIFGVLGFGILLFIWRFVTLMLSGAKIKSQMKSSTPGKNPLGRIMAVYLANKDASVEDLELKLDEAVLKETPRLESGITFIKVLAAVAPLMGLLGTVTGMILTFQNITLFGTGDVRLMADGISTALMTTVMGIIAAIPLILAHAFVAGRSKSLIHILEQQSAGYIAQHAEQEGAK